MIVVGIVLAQLEGSGRGALGAYDGKAAQDLQHFLLNVPMKDGDEWLTQLTRQNSSLGLRLMEVRDSYCSEAFEWDQLQRLAHLEIKEGNTKLMKKFATASLEALMTSAAASGGSLASASGDDAGAPVSAGAGGGEEGAGAGALGQGGSGPAGAGGGAEGGGAGAGQGATGPAVGGGGAGGGGGGPPAEGAA